MFINPYADSKIESSKCILVHTWHILSELDKNVNKVAQSVHKYAIYVVLVYLY